MLGTGNDDDQARRAATPAFLRARRRAWVALGCAALGVWLSAGLGGGSWWWFAGAVVLTLAGAVLPARWWWVGACGGVVCAMGGWSAVRFREPSPMRVDRLVGEGVVTLIGRVSTAPAIDDPPSGPGAPGSWRDPSLVFDVRVGSVVDGSGQHVDARGVVGVRAPAEAAGRVRLGDRVRVTGELASPSGRRNPGEPDWTRYANERGRAGWLAVPSPTLIEPLAGGTSLWTRVLRARDAARGRAFAALGADRDGVLGALVLGERDRRFDGTYRVFQRAGVAHVLAVSGFHLAMLGGVAVLVVRLTGERGRLETVAALLVVGAMLTLVPARAPIVRAGVLLLVLLLGDAIGRRWDRLSVLAWAGLGLLVWRPGDALGLGYLLSIGVTALLIAAGECGWSNVGGPAKGLGAWSREHVGWFGAAWRWLLGAARINAACWAAGMPTIIAFTGVCSFVAPIATLVMVPLSGVLLTAGWAQALLGILWPGAAAHTSGVLGALAEVVAGVARWFDRLPLSSVNVVGVGWVWSVLATVCVVAWLFRLADRRWSAACVLACVLYAGIATDRAGRVDGLRADMLDVGDGTCVLLRSGDDVILWDCGGLHRPVGGMVGDAARALGVARIRTAVVTHANLDHYNGLPVAAERLGIERVLVSPALMAGRSGDWGGTRARLESLGVRIVALDAGDAIPLGAARGSVLWAGASDAPRWLGNDGSLVVRFAIPTSAGERSLLLCGDVQTAGIAGVLDNAPDLRVDVVEAPHHGSAHPPAVAFVENLGVSHVLQSTGPGRVGLEAWSGVRAQTTWLSTGESGAVCVHLRPDGVIESGVSR